MQQAQSAISMPETSDARRLYQWTAALSGVMLFLIPVQMIIYVLAPPPATVAGFFRLFHENWLLGLLSLDLLYILNNTILIIIYAALFMRLRGQKPAASLVAFALGLVGIASYFPSNPAFEMLTLSGKYFQAAPSGQAWFLAAGEALLAGYTGTAFDVYYVLNAVALVMFALLILKSPHFSRTIGIWGLIAGILMSVPSSAGTIGMVFAILSLIPWAIFVFLLVKRFQVFAASEP